LIESATQNIVRYCIIKGAGLGTDAGMIAFRTASTGSGNDSNEFQKCLFTGLSATNRPSIVIYSSGTSGRENSGNIIRNCELADHWLAGSSSDGILLSAASTDWIITGNSFYLTSSLTPTGAYAYSWIRINDQTSKRHQCLNNYFGCTQAGCLCSAMIAGSTSVGAYFRLIAISTATDQSCIFQGNVITNLALSSSSSTPFAAYYVTGG
jgi:hypothetical protein